MKSAVLALNLGTILGSGENINLYYLVYSNTYLIIMAEGVSAKALRNVAVSQLLRESMSILSTNAATETLGNTDDFGAPRQAKNSVQKR